MRRFLPFLEFFVTILKVICLFGMLASPFIFVSPFIYLAYRDAKEQKIREEEEAKRLEELVEKAEKAEKVTEALFYKKWGERTHGKIFSSDIEPQRVLLKKIQAVEPWMFCHFNKVFHKEILKKLKGDEDDCFLYECATRSPEDTQNILVGKLSPVSPYRIDFLSRHDDVITFIESLPFGEQWNDKDYPTAQEINAARKRGWEEYDRLWYKALHLGLFFYLNEYLKRARSSRAKNILVQKALEYKWSYIHGSCFAFDLPESLQDKLMEKIINKEEVSYSFQDNFDTCWEHFSSITSKKAQLLLAKGTEDPGYRAYHTAYSADYEVKKELIHNDMRKGKWARLASKADLRPRRMWGDKIIWEVAKELGKEEELKKALGDQQ